MPELSIIVPIYNIEKYLDQCISSILAQTFKDFELILVDDGSTDGCAVICDGYAIRDERIKVIHKKNEGLVRARKTGLEYAAGKYITYVDGDDWIDNTMYEHMLSHGQDADIIICGIVKEYDSTSVEISNEIESGLYEGIELQKLYSQLLYTGEFYKAAVFPAVWNKLYKREVLFENQMSVKDDTRMGEDAMCTYPSILDAKSVMVMNDIHPYHYRRQGATMSNSYDKNYFNRIFSLLNDLKEIFEKKKASDIIEQLDYYEAFLVLLGVEQEMCLSKKKVKEITQYLASIVEKNQIKTLIQRLNFAGFSREQKNILKMIEKGKYIHLYMFFVKKKVGLKIGSMLKW